MLRITINTAQSTFRKTIIGTYKLFWLLGVTGATPRREGVYTDLEDIALNLWALRCIQFRKAGDLSRTISRGWPSLDGDGLRPD